MSSFVYGNNFGESLKNAPKGIQSTRDLLNWLRGTHRGTRHYWDRLFVQAKAVGAGDLPITRRRLYERYMEAYKQGNEKRMKQILALHERTEEKFFRNIRPKITQYLDRFSKEDLLVVEAGCAKGRMTKQILPEVLKRGGHYVAFDGSEDAVKDARKNLVASGILTQEDARLCVQVADARQFGEFIRERNIRHHMRVIVLQIRFDLHLVNNLVWTKFMREVGEFVYLHHGAVVHAQTSADDFTPEELEERRQPGTVFKTGEEIKQGYKKLRLDGRRKLIRHHGDPIRLAGYIPIE